MNHSLRSVANVLAYLGVILVAASLIVSSLFQGYQFSYILSRIASLISYILLIISSFMYAKSRRSVVYLIVWLVAVVLIVVSYII